MSADVEMSSAAVYSSKGGKVDVLVGWVIRRIKTPAP
jgi:hypothetical protein